MFWYNFIILILALGLVFFIIRRFFGSSTTRQARRLARLLARRRVKNRLEYWDGNKHVDINIPSANLNIELDGSQHYLDPDQIISDIKRDCASCRVNAYTFRVPNAIVDRYAEDLADAVAEAVRRLEKNFKT